MVHGLMEGGMALQRSPGNRKQNKAAAKSGNPSNRKAGLYAA